MTYGLSPRAFVEDGPAVQAMKVQAAHSTARSWHALNPERRIALVDRALKPANDLVDGYPIAL
jgi:hypothetical protein